MGAIAGIISRDKKPIRNLLIQMLNKMDMPVYDGYDLLIGQNLVTANNLESIELSVSNDAIGIGTAYSTNNIIKIQSLLSKDSFYTYSGRLSNAECLVDPRPGEGYDLKFAIPELFKDQVDGFALIVKHRNEITIVRDIIGIKPLFIAENDEYTAFASEKKALWELDQVDSVRPVCPGELLKIGAKSINTSDLRIELEKDIKQENFEACQKQAKKLLVDSISKRITDKRIAVLFSGGLDSTIIAQIIKQLKNGPKVQLFTACFKDGRDFENSSKVAKILGLPLTIVELTDGIIEEKLPEIIYHLETPDTLAVEIAIPLYFATKAAAKEGFDRVFSGQGADELFAGYSRYEGILKTNDYKKLHDTLYDDMMILWSHDMERDSMITSANDIELVLPFLDLDFIQYSLSIPPEYKLKEVDTGFVRKYLLYALGKQIGLDKEILDIPKTAAQYGSGASKSLKRIAAKFGYNKDLAMELGFKTNTEILTNVIFNSLDFPNELKSQVLEELVEKIKNKD
jgi:asparagine synthase (glutamine-hydrolysing)